MRIKLGIDTEGLDFGFAAVVDGVKRSLQFNDTVDFVLYALDSNKSELEKTFMHHERVLIKTAPMSAHADLPATDLIRDLQEDLESEQKQFKYTMSYMIYDSITQKLDSCIIPGHAGHLTAIARHIERHLGRFNPLFPQCFGTFIPTKTLKPRIMLDLGAFLKQDLFKLAVLGEHFIRYYAGIENPKVGFLNIGSEETKGPPEIREAATAYKKYKPNALYEAGFIEPDKIFDDLADCDVIACNALHGNLVVKASKGTAKFLESILRDSSLLFKIVAGHSLKRLLERYSPDVYSSAIIFGYSSLMLKTNGSANSNAIYNAIQSAIKFRGSFHLFHSEFTQKAKELFSTLEPESKSSDTKDESQGSTQEAL